MNDRNLQPDRARRSLLLGIGIGVAGSAAVALTIVAARDDGSDPLDVAGVDDTAAPFTAPIPLPVTGPAPDGPGSVTDTEPATPAGGAAAMAPVALPDGRSVTCPPATTTVSTAEQLQVALDAAEPGDVIALAPGRYVGTFVAARPGTTVQPIFLCGAAETVLDGGAIKNGYVVHLDGADHWRVVGFTVRNGQKGVVVDAATDVVIQGLTVEDIGDEAIHLRSATTSSAVLGNTVRRTGLRREKFGEGIYVGSATSNWATYSGGDPDRSDGVVIEGNAISETTSEAIDIKEGTTGGRVIGNTMDGRATTHADSLVDVKGNDWLIEGNRGTNAPEDGFQTHRILDGWGSGNVFRANTIDVIGDGDHIYIHDPDVTANVVACDNRTSSGDAVRSNVACVT